MKNCHCWPRYLLPPYELAEWRQATVQFNYDISFVGMLYSVLHEYIKRKVDVRVTDKTIEVFYNHNQIASHRRLYGRKGQYSTITEHMPTGATGSEKTYVVCAFGMEGCKRRYTTKYVRLPDLLLELGMARNDGTYKEVQSKYANPVLLIIDEWLLLKPIASEQHDILELLHRRRKKSSTIFCSHYDCNGWFDQLGGDDSPLAEAILDRIKHDAYKINIIPTAPANYRSMREVYGLDPALSE